MWAHTVVGWDVERDKQEKQSTWHAAYFHTWAHVGYKVKLLRQVLSDIFLLPNHDILTKHYEN